MEKDFQILEKSGEMPTPDAHEEAAHFQSDFTRESIVSFDWLIQRMHTVVSSEDFGHEDLLLNETDHFSKFFRNFHLDHDEIVLVMVALAASIEPSLLDTLKSELLNGKASISGGRMDRETGIFRPTIRTVVYLLAGNDPLLRAKAIRNIQPKSRPFLLGVVKAFPFGKDIPFLDYQISFNDQFLNAVLWGDSPRLDGDPGFPVNKGTSTHMMKDVIVKEKTMLELLKLQRFARNMSKLWNMHGSNKVRRNYLCVFSGDPGTGKSFAAEAVGNELQLPVYRVNLAQMVSKYIGETEKNLEAVFDRFNRQPGILFFDEAESIFSKRIEVKDSHDQYANNLQSYLLQKVEDFEGIIVLATNVKDLTQFFDKAFQRRIRSIVEFEFPDFEERLPIWQNSLFDPFVFETGIVENIARNYQLSGGSIYNIVSDAVIEALDTDQLVISKEMLESAMRVEFRKTGRVLEVCTDDMVKVNPMRRFGVGFEKRKNF